jgi:calcineurin-like phosphoesterase family protein
MGGVYFTTDWHLGNKGILKYRSGHETLDDHDMKLFDGHRKTVKSKNDTTYFLGDMFYGFSEEYRQEFAKLSGKKILVMGNHDNIPIRELITIFDDVVGPIKYNSTFWLTHHPIHPQELYGKVNIHGHTHNQFVLTSEGKIDRRYVNVCPDVNNYVPVSLEQIRKRLAG